MDHVYLISHYSTIGLQNGLVLPFHSGLNQHGCLLLTPDATKFFFRSFSKFCWPTKNNVTKVN